MSRKDTVWGARHVQEDEELKRITEFYADKLHIIINKLEASAVAAARSKSNVWSDKEARDFLLRLRGML